MSQDIPDDRILRLAADWQVARLRAMLLWAENDRDTYFGWRDETKRASPDDALKAMEHCQRQLAACQPRTVEGARVMLLVVRSILAHQMIDPEGEAIMSSGPLLEMVTAIHAALHYGPGDVVLRDAA